jgi:hypothetical protein
MALCDFFLQNMAIIPIFFPKKATYVQFALGFFLTIFIWNKHWLELRSEKK